MAASAATLWLPSADDTVALGAALAGSCRRDGQDARMLLLSGELGAGKTTLAAALLGALGVDEVVRSPTYALVEAYPIPAGIAVHVDCYRLHDATELEALGLRDYYVPGAIWLVEWPERAASALPPADLGVALSMQEAGRRARLDAYSAAGRDWLGRLLSLTSYVANKA
ncbi:MAG TPA: tRNA (adenosine(37)-N6)-threonylcarbamoyltransferase complex ATPase subunit type 1 TsaE [Steroidobacteraceae bacterium]